MVGATGFEPVTTRTPSVCATRLRYAPTGALIEREFTIPQIVKQFMEVKEIHYNGRARSQWVSRQESSLRRDSSSFLILAKAVLYFWSASGNLSWSFSSFLVSFNFFRAPSI